MTTAEGELFAADLDWDDDDSVDVPPTNEVAATRTYDPINVSSDAFWSIDLPDREPIFAELRRDRPVSWQPPIETAVSPDPDDPGYWAVVRHADIVEISQNNDVFRVPLRRHVRHAAAGVSGDGHVVPAMDNPQHHKIRRLVSSVFTRGRFGASKPISPPAPNALWPRQSPKPATASRSTSSPTWHGTCPPKCSVTCSASPRRCGLRWSMPPTRHRPGLIRCCSPAVIRRGPGRGGAAHPRHDEGLIEARREKPEEDLLSAWSTPKSTGNGSRSSRSAPPWCCSRSQPTTPRDTRPASLPRHSTTFPDQRQWLWEDFEGASGWPSRSSCGGLGRAELPPHLCSPYELAANRFCRRQGRDDMPQAIGTRRSSTSPTASTSIGGPNPHMARWRRHPFLPRQSARQGDAAFGVPEIHSQMPDFTTGEPELVRTNFIRGVLSMPFDPGPAR